MRKPVIAGNWKMNLDIEAGALLAHTIASTPVDYSTREVIICPDFVSVGAIKVMCESLADEGGDAGGVDGGSPASGGVIVASQDISQHMQGAYTGEVSLPMLSAAGITHTLIGHSERRMYHHETDTILNAKLLRAIGDAPDSDSKYAPLTAILCVGETLDDRESGKANDVVLGQLKGALAGVKSYDKIIIAYEPVWAIGTGKTATSADAQSMHSAIRTFLAEFAGNGVAESMRILYGGSVKPENISELMSQSDVDGVLVGGASLDADSFIKIINY